MKRIYTILLFSLTFVCALCAQNNNSVDYYPNITEEHNIGGLDQNKPNTHVEDSAFTGEIKIHPNPASDFFRITTDEKIGNVQVINLLGTVVKQFDKFHGDYYNLSGIPSGIYFIKINHSDSNKSRTVRLKVQ